MNYSFNIKSTVFLLIVSVFLCSCKKKKEIKEQTITDEVVPEIFIKRTLAEKLTGEFCGTCPLASSILEQKKVLYGNNFIFAEIHAFDPFETAQAQYLIDSTIFNIQYFPSLILNKTYNNSSQSSLGIWQNIIDSAVMDSIANLGIKIETKINNTLLDINICIASNQILGESKLTVYLIEDNVTESFLNAQSGAQPGYVHRNVLRHTLTSINGDDLHINNVNEIYKRSFSAIDIQGYKKNDLKVIVFVSNNPVTQNDLKIYNVNEVKVGENTYWN